MKESTIQLFELQLRQFERLFRANGNIMSLNMCFYIIFSDYPTLSIIDDLLTIDKSNYMRVVLGTLRLTLDDDYSIDDNYVELEVS